MLSSPATTPQPAALTWLRLGFVGLAFILQLALFVVGVLYFSSSLPWLFTAHLVISGAVVLAIAGSTMRPEYKLMWSLPIVIVPLVGGMFYLVYGRNHFTPRERATLRKPWDHSRTLLARAATPVEFPADTPAGPRRQEHYLRATAGYPASTNTLVTYYPTGEDAFEAMLAELEKAEDYILFQYFIITAGHMWDRLHAILARKAAAGVRVHILYDDLGSVFTLPRHFRRNLEAEGIHVQPINPFGFRMLLRYNNRNHEKILVIDGKVGFTGGINIGDEYINRASPYGYWKDTAVRLEGSAVYNLAIMFATVWNGGKEPLDWQMLTPPASTQPDDGAAHGIVQPYDDSPFDDLLVGQDAYLNLLSTARKTVDITSPYLIVDAEVTGALMRAARAGVRVRIITPHIGDSWFVHETTRASYPELIAAGVEIYEYKPGYMHAKMMIADEDSAIIGTINHDYRSLHLHQECGVWLYQVPIIAHMRADIERTLQSCIPISLEECRKTPWLRRAVRRVLRAFAPLM